VNLALSQAIHDYLFELGLRDVTVHWAEELDAAGGRPTGRWYLWLTHAVLSPSRARDALVMVDGDAVDGVKLHPGWAHTYVERFLSMAVRKP